MSQKPPTTVRLDDDNQINVEEHMREHGSTKSRLINVALRRYFEEEAKKSA